jgi:multidrug efflux pump subunit AcrA (membrane-fusion protein)
MAFIVGRPFQGRPQRSSSLCSSRAAAEEEEESEPVVTVDVAPVLLSKIQRTIRADGLIYPRQQAAIIPKVTAPVKRNVVQRGARVRAGQLLVELENQDLTGAAVESRGTLNQAEAQFETTSKATVPEELQKAELDAKAAQDAAVASQSVYENRQQLYREGAIAQKDVNDAQVAASQARAQAETAKKRFDDLRSFANDQALKPPPGSARRRPQRIGAGAALLSRLTSPIDGVVTDLPFYPGRPRRRERPSSPSWICRA